MIESEDSHLIQQAGAPSWAFPRRVIILVLVFFGVLLGTQGRLILSISVLPISDELGWDEKTQGLVLGSFGMGYVWTQFPAIYLERKIGAKIPLAVAIGCGGPFLFLFPFVVSVPALASFCYIVYGLLQGPLWVGVYAIILDWFPKEERASAYSLLTIASIGGTVTALGLTPLVIDAAGWKSCFFLCGGVNTLWGILFLLFGQPSPESGKYDVLYVPKEEYDYVINNRSERKALENVPWKAIFSHPAIFAIYVNQFANNFGYYVTVSWIPTFLKKQLGFDLRAAGFLSVLPYILQGISAQGSAQIADALIKRGYVSKWYIRKVGHTIGFGVPALMLCFVSFLEASVPTIVALLTCALAVNGVVSVGYQMSYFDLNPTYSSLIFSIGNTISAVNASLSVYLVGFILDQTNFNWAVVWMLGATLWVIGLLLFLFIVPVDEVDFDALAGKEKAEETDEDLGDEVEFGGYYGSLLHATELNVRFVP